MIVDEIHLEQRSGRVRLVGEVSWEDRTRDSRDLWYEVSAEHATAMQPRADAFLVSCAVLAQHHGERRLRLATETWEALNKIEDFHTWGEWRDLALADIDIALPDRVPDEGHLGTPDTVYGRPRIELYQLSADDVAAALVSELKRQVAAGVHHLVVAWPSSWWLDVYGEFASYLDSKQRLLLSTERVRMYELAGPVG